MAIKSALRPESIVKERPKSVQSAQNFISGGAPLGSSVVSSAANKIVGFQRAAVKPVTPDINSIVSTISSNILTQVDNSIRNATNITNKQVDGKIKQVDANITNQVQQIKQEQTNQVTQLQTFVQNIRQQTNNFAKQLSEDYKKRIQDVDTAKPIGILDRFLKAYQNAIGFIQFFGSGKNIKQLREGLQTLKTSFTESFEIAKLIRQTILKIVTQLSNLPKATPGASPGLSLDVDVPGGPLKRTAPRNARFGGRGAGMLGLGLGAVAAGTAVNALADTDRLQTLPQVVGGLTGGIIDSFAFIVSKFANAVEEMIKGSTNKETPSSQPGPSTGGAAPTAKPSSPGTGTTPGSTMTPGGAPPEIKALMDAISSTEGTWDSVNYGKGPGKIKGLENMTIDQALSASDEYRKKYGGTGTLGRYQHHPDYLRKRAIDAGLDPKTALFTKENQSLIQRVFLDKTFGGEAQLVEQVRKKDWQGLSKKLGQNIGWPSLPGGSQAQPGYTYQQFGTKVETALKNYVSLKPPSAKPDKGMGMLEGVDPSMIDVGQRKALGINISQPPPSQAKPSIVSLPLAGGQQMPQQQSGGGGGQMIIPPEQKGPSVPLLPSSDSNNFMTMYSKIVYNIVDD